MPHRINEDNKRFRDVVSGKTRRELKRLISTGSIVRQRPRGGKMTIKIPRIDTPFFVHGDSDKGIGRGPGKEGDIIGQDPKRKGKGKGKGNQAGDESAEGIHITIDMEDVLQFLQDELKLPRMRPKPNETYEEVKIKYNDISKQGPESLRHTRRTMTEAVKRLALTGNLEKLHSVPGCKTPIKLITPINSDRRYRQFNEIKIPTSNAVIFFARDCSGSMDDYKCDIVSDMSWWIDCWIKKFYKKVERSYFVHDTVAAEVDEESFYTYRHGGGTMCSSVFKSIAEQIENKYPPSAYNIYIFYFTDGDNWGNDNEKMVEIISEKLDPKQVNMIGVSQICSWRYQNSVMSHFDEAVKQGKLDADYFRTSQVGPNDNSAYGTTMEEDERNDQILKAIKKMLSAGSAQWVEV